VHPNRSVLFREDGENQNALSKVEPEGVESGGLATKSAYITCLQVRQPAQEILLSARELPRLVDLLSSPHRTHLIQGAPPDGVGDQIRLEDRYSRLGQPPQILEHGKLLVHRRIPSQARPLGPELPRRLHHGLVWEGRLGTSRRLTVGCRVS